MATRFASHCLETIWNPGQFYLTDLMGAAFRTPRARVQHAHVDVEGRKFHAEAPQGLEVARAWVLHE